MTRQQNHVVTNPGASSPCCNQQTSQLLVVDIQEKLGATMPEKVLSRVTKNVSLLLNAASLLHVPVTISEQYPKGLGHTDARVSSALPANSRRIEKTLFSCVGASGFEPVLADPVRRQIVIVGMEAHVCVLQTVFDLAAAGVQPFVVEDAICSRRLENYQNALYRMRQSG